MAIAVSRAILVTVVVCLAGCGDTSHSATSHAEREHASTGKAGGPEPLPGSQPRQGSTASTTAQPMGSGSTSPAAGCPSGWTLGICPLPAPVGGSTFDAKLRAAIDKESDGLTNTAFRVTAPSSDRLVWEMTIERQPLSRGLPNCLEDGTGLAKVASEHTLSFRGDSRRASARAPMKSTRRTAGPSTSRKSFGSSMESGGLPACLAAPNT